MQLTTIIFRFLLVVALIASFFYKYDTHHLNRFQSQRFKEIILLNELSYGEDFIPTVNRFSKTSLNVDLLVVCLSGLMLIVNMIMFMLDLGHLMYLLFAIVSFSVYLYCAINYQHKKSHTYSDRFINIADRVEILKIEKIDHSLDCLTILIKRINH